MVVVVAILGSWVSMETLGLFVAKRTAGEFCMVLLIDAVLVESLSDSRS